MKYSLNIDNYRSFKNLEFDFTRVNILIGENSSGKSSLLKFLLILKQSLENSKEANLLLSGEYADVGNYNDMIYFHKTDENLTFEFTFKSDYYDFFKRTMFFDESILDDEEIDEETKEEAEIERKIKGEIFEQIENTETSIKFIISNELDKHKTIKTIIKNTSLGEVE